MHFFRILHSLSSIPILPNLRPSTLCEEIATMKQVITVADSSAEVITRITSTSIPEPSDKQVLIKVVVSGSNPKDWKAPEYAANYHVDDDSFMARCKAGINQGDDIAGIVEKVGKDVIGFKVCKPQICGWKK
jgi:NADPH:quinone reductase-like Zn-dependent oxidoreductase